MRHWTYKKDLQQSLRCWFQGDVSKISQDGMSALLTYFLQNKEIQEVKKCLRLIAKGGLPQTGNINSILPVAKRLVDSRTREQDFQIPIFMFSTSRSGSIYIRDSMMKSFGYIQLRGFVNRPMKQTQIGFHDFAGDTAALNGHPGYISNVHLLPTAENIETVSRLSQRAHMVFLFRHPLASLFSFFYRIANRPREHDTRDMTSLNEDEKWAFLEEIIKDNLNDYTIFYGKWLEIISKNSQLFTTVCYEDFEDDLDEAVSAIVIRIGLDPSQIVFPEKNATTNYQREERPNYADILPSSAFDLYREPIEFFQGLRKFSIGY